MICLEISRNSTLLCRAGIENASMLSLHLSAFVGADYLAHLFIGGMCDLDGERTAHVNWGDIENMSAGGKVTVALINSDYPTKPIEVKATDSPEYLEEQAKFIEFDKSFVPDSIPAERKLPKLAFDCSINGEHKATAILAPNEEHILCSVTWDKWRPERCRVFVRSFVGSERSGNKLQTEWLRANLQLGDLLEIGVSA